MAKPHDLVQRTSAILEKSTPDLYGRLRISRRNCLDIHVSKAQLGRALRLIDGLIKALGSRGFDVGEEPDRRGGTYVTVLSEKVEFGLDEQVQQVKHVPTAEERAQQVKYDWESWPKHDYKPTGRLRLTIKEHWPEGGRKKWTDRKKVPLEDQLNKFVVGLVATSIGLREKRLEREAWSREWERRRAQARAKKLAQEQEQARRDLLKSQAANWAQAKSIRVFVRELKEIAATEPENIRPVSLQNWVDWAQTVVTDLDPLADGVNQVLAEYIEQSPSLHSD